MAKGLMYFSMFSGIGGFELGIHRACSERNNSELRISNDRHSGCNKTSQSNESEICRNYACIGYSEVDKYAIQIYKNHFKEHKNYGDARRIVWESMPNFDMLCGGFPCQAFSIAGKRGGFEDTRGTLFHEIAKGARIKRPKLLFLENVKGLLSHDNGRTFGTILATLSDLGYILEWQVLNSKDYGVPQNRERVFIIGHLGKGCGQQVFPIGEIGTVSDTQDSRQQRKGQRICSTIDSRYGALRNAGETYMIRDGKDNRSCLRSGRTPELGIKGVSIRRLTPTECERLQGFPDGWTEGVSDIQRYKCLGNAVTVNVIEAIARKLWIN